MSRNILKFGGWLIIVTLIIIILSVALGTTDTTESTTVIETQDGSIEEVSIDNSTDCYIYTIDGENDEVSMSCIDDR